MKRASPSPNYTQIPNCILDRMGDYSDAELRVMLVICRNTLGWHKEKVVLTLKLAAHKTGMTDTGCGNALKTLLGEGVIDRVKDGKTFAYRLAIFDDERPNDVGTSDEASSQARSDIPTKPVGTDTKEKEISKTKDTVTGEGEEGINPHQAFIDLWVECYKIQFGEDYVFMGGKDASAVKRLLAQTKKSPKELIDIATRAWAKRTGDCFNCKRAVEISIFASVFNQVLIELNPPGRNAPVAKVTPPAGLKPYSTQPTPGFDEAGKKITMKEWEEKFPLSLYYDDATGKAMA